jgi:spermine oxidase
VSLGVLKAASGSLFDPPLPHAKAAAIDRLRIGVVDKVILDFAPPGASSGSGTSGEAGSATEAAATHSDAPDGPAVSYALLWGGPWEGRDSASAPALTSLEEELPGWVRGIFSIRFGGPELKRPAGQPAPGLTQQEAEEAEEEEEYSPCAEATQPSCYQAVAWVAGEAAAAMEAASDEEVLGALRTLASRTFPLVQLPPGARWDAVRLHR